MPGQHILVTCQSCGTQLKAPVALAGKQGRCQCGASVPIPLDAPEPPGAAETPRTAPRPAPPKPPGPKTLHKDTPPRALGSGNTVGIAMGFGLVALLALAFSPMLPWLQMSGEGMEGVYGKGFIVLVASLAFAALATGAFLFNRLPRYAATATAAWGTAATFWLAAIVWRILNGKRTLAENPLTASFAFQINPGLGLYIGLIAAIVVAGSFILIERRMRNGSSILKRHGVLALPQLLAIAVAIGLMLLDGYSVSAGASSTTTTPPAAFDPSHENNESAASHKSKANREQAVKLMIESEEYIKNVKVQNVHVGETILGEKAVFGEVKNAGNRTLDKVIAIIYCLDDQGNAVHDDVFFPVVGYGSHIDAPDKGPLKPNYSRKFGYKMDSAPSEWNGKVRVVVREVKLIDPVLEDKTPASTDPLNEGGTKTEEETAPAPDANEKEPEEEYIAKVILRNVTMGKSTTGKDGVFGELKNTGNRTLDEVEITIYYLDKTGKPIYERKYSPVFVERLSFDPDTRQPLKPNYVREFGYTLHSPSEWSGKVNVAVTKVKFAD